MEPFGYTQHYYCLMEREGKFQWRWVNPPPEAPSIELSPCFDTVKEAEAWNEARIGPPHQFISWKPVNSGT